MTKTQSEYYRVVNVTGKSPRSGMIGYSKDIVIPKPICRQLGLNAGDIIRFKVKSNQIILNKVEQI